jgi:hypothetical protein
VFTAEHLLDLGRFDLTEEPLQRRLQIVADAFPLARPVDQYL